MPSGRDPPRSAKPAPAPPEGHEPASEAAPVGWKDDEQWLPPERLAILWEIYDPMERAIAERSLPWQPRLMRYYFGFYRPGTYYCCGMNLPREQPLEFWISSPFPPAELRLTNVDIADLYPDSRITGTQTISSGPGRFPPFHLIPDLGKAVEAHQPLPTDQWSDVDTCELKTVYAASVITY